jgi:hypothetical protein
MKIKTQKIRHLRLKFDKIHFVSILAQI